MDQNQSRGSIFFIADDIHEEPELFEDHDDGLFPPVIETVENSSSSILLKRISWLTIEMAKNLAQVNYGGVHPTYHVGGKTPEDQLRGLVLLENVNMVQYCADHGIFMTHCQLFHYIREELKALDEYVKELWLQMRPNCRLVEKILMVPRHSLPFFGRPEGFFGLGRSVKLEIDGKLLGPVGKEFQIPFGEKSVSGLGQFNTGAKLIVFVQSRGELNNLIQEKVLEKAQNTIFVTSCGEPDLGFCMMLAKLAKDTQLPVRFLVDSDLRGFLIVANLAFGRFDHRFKDRDEFLTPFMQPLGILPAQFLPSDTRMSKLSASDQTGILILKNKWEGHKIELVQGQKFWLEVIDGFQSKGKTMSIIQMRLNRGPNFILNKIISAEKTAQILGIIEKTKVEIPLTRVSKK